MNVKSILFPTDFSESGEGALRYASSLAAQTGAKLHVLHVADDSPAYLAAYDGIAYIPDLPEQLEHQNRAALDRVEPTAAGVECERHYLTGAAARRIVEFADQESIDLIVMGTHGRSGVSRLLMGSIAEEVLRHASCPVLTVKHPVDAESSSRDPAEQAPETRAVAHWADESKSESG